jgi:O-antigen ligase
MQKVLKKLESYFKGKQLFLVGLKALIVLSPLPFGSVIPFFSPLFYLCLLLLGLYGYRQQFHEREILGEQWIMRGAFVMGGFFVLQLIPLPRFLLQLISPTTVDTLAKLKETVPAFHPVSLVPFLTLETLAHFLVFVFMGLLLTRMNLKRREMMGILTVIVYSGVFQAVFGLAKYFSGNRKFFLLFHTQKQDVYSNYLTGTIGNPNHFAFYLELVFPIALAILFMQVDSLKIYPSFQERMHQVVDFKNKSLLFFGGILLIGLAILLTGSRAGIITIALSALVFVQLSVYLAGKKEIRKRLKWIFIVVILFASLVGIQSTIEKFMKSPLASSGRMTRWPDSLEMVLDFPVAGTGFGTYKYAFFLYDSEGIKWSTHAHNDYLEILSDGGAAGLLAFAFLAWGFMNAYVRRWWERRHPQIKMVGIGILTAFFAAMFHSLFDFSLRIPANMLVLVVLAGIGVNLVTYRRERSHTPFRPRFSPGVKVVSLILAVFLVSQLVSHLGLAMGRRSPSFGRILLKLSTLAMPLDSETHLEYGYRILQDNEEKGDRDLLLKGISALERAVATNVLTYNGHYFLAKGYLFADRPGQPYFDRAVQSFKRAGLLRPKNPDISLDTLKVHMSLWNLLGNEDRVFVRRLFADALGQLDSPEVLSLLELWGLYIRDVTFLERALERYPHFYLEAAQKMTELEMDLSQRQRFLARYEAYWLGYSHQKIKELLSLKNVPIKDLESFLTRFSNSIIGYHKLVRDSRFDTPNYMKLKRQLYYTVIRAFLSREEGFKYLEEQDRIVSLVAKFVQDFPQTKYLNEIMLLLDKHRFFPRSGLQGKEMRIQILSRLKNYNQLILEARRLKNSITFVTSNQERFFAGILLLLADADMESGNYIEALTTLEAVRPFESRKNELFWRLNKLERLAKEAGLPDPDTGTIRMDPERERVDFENRNSRVIVVNGLRKSVSVYPHRGASLEIHPGDELGPKLEGKHVVQVLVDGELYAESYLGDWLDKPLIVPIKPELLDEIIRVDIKVL